MRRHWPTTTRDLATVAVLQYGPCWCRGKPGDTGTFDLFRQRSVRMDLGPLTANLLIVTDRVLSGAEKLCRQVYNALASPKIVIATPPCPSAGRFWDEAPLAWVPVRELLPVQADLDSCFSGAPESLLGAVLPMVGILEELPLGTAALQHTGA